MKDLPETIDTVEQLEEVLSRPSDALVEFMAALDGDVMILGAGGKVGPTMVRTARRAIEAAGVQKKVIAVDVAPLDELRGEGIETISCDLLEAGAAEELPKVENVIYMVGRKFGSTGSESLTWAINVIAACNAARALTGSRIVAFSTGCVYPVMDLATCGATEETQPDPVGEYAMSCLGRERMFDHFSETAGERVLHFRLNYAVELRYGVLVDVAAKVFSGEAVDVTTGYANVLWQGDVCNVALRSLAFAASPAKALNVTGPEIFSIRWAAERFGRLFGKTPTFSGQENARAYLNNAAQAARLLGHPSVSLDRIIEWTAHWMSIGGQDSGKPTNFQTQDGKY